MSRGKVLITGGAGFIGSNLANRLAASGREVVVFDNFSRPGVEQNADWLRAAHPSRIRIEIGDVRKRPELRRALHGVTEVFHFAAQVAVTTSLTDPMADFDVNARGTINVLEEIRAMDSPPSLLFTSTNKVYGDLNHLKLHRNRTRYVPAGATIETLGVSEQQPLSFYSPYGCSKGTADQYVLDYAHSYGLMAAVFRMSCIYGPHQFGTEDQGWVAHFVIRTLAGEPLTIYGDGLQVRDLLFVEDLLDAFQLAQENIDSIAGQAFNIGGGPANAISLVELMDVLHRLHGERPDLQFEDWRTGDQRYYVSDTRRFQAATGWAPRTNVKDGLRQLYDWLSDTRSVAQPRALAGGGGS